LLKTGYRQIPVVKGQIIQGMIARSDLIRIALDIKELRDIHVQDVMTTPVQTVRSVDPVETALMSMKNLTIQTLPVIDEHGNLTGIVGIKEVASYNWKDKKRETVGEVSGNSGPVDLKVSSIALDGVFTIEPKADLGKAIKLMLDRKISSLPVVTNGSLVGILTKYDIIELLASFKQRDVVYTQITGLGQEERFVLDQMDREIGTALQKIAKISRPMLFTMHVTKYNSQGNNFKYSLNGRLITENKIWVANAVDWDLMKATNTLMQHFERRVVERKEENVDLRKHTRDIGHNY
jgi:CBS domain-containing protein